MFYGVWLIDMLHNENSQTFYFETNLEKIVLNMENSDGLIYDAIILFYENFSKKKKN